MRRHAGLTVALLLAASGTSAALERTATPAPSLDREAPWSSSGDVTIAYYNTCTGWTWTWRHLGAHGLNEGYGVVFDPGSEDLQTLAGTWEFNGSDGFSRGYGFLTLYDLEEDGSQGAMLVQKAGYPIAGWAYHAWNIPVDGPVLVQWEYDWNWFTDLVTDHPAAGPDGSPPACGTCYPSPREANSFYDLYPGKSFDDGSGCEAELLWEAVFSTAATSTPEGVEQESWGRLRNMYR
jgi:hypothetical protein